MNIKYINKYNKQINIEYDKQILNIEFEYDIDL